MKVVIATPLYPPEIGGPATYAEILNTELPKRGIEVTLVKFSEVRHLPKVFRHYAYYLRVYEALKNADKVLALDPVSVGWGAERAAKCLNKPLVVKIVGDYAWEQGRQRFGVADDLDTFVSTKQKSMAVRFLQKIQTRVARSATRVIVPSEYLKKIVTRWGIKEERIMVIYNAVPIGEVGTVPAAVTALSRPLVATAGRLVPWKHIDLLIDAIANTNGMSLVIVGDGPEAASLKQRSEKIQGRVVFTGQLSHADTLATVASADMFVLNSSYEGFSHLLVEALSLGVPTIATEAGGNGEIVEHEINGLLVKPLDPHALATALARVGGDEALRANLAEKARESSRRFTVERMIESTVTLLQKI